MRTIAAIDIGTNSVRLLVARFGNGFLIPVQRGLVSTRLGENMSCGGNLDEAAQRRTLEALARFRTLFESLEALPVAVATSAVREAGNGQDFAAAAGAVLNAPVRVIDGHEEARLSYLGAVWTLGGDLAVVDIGGGSTELVFPQDGGLVSFSCPVGAVRCTTESMEPSQIERILLPATSIVPGSLPLVGVGGTVTTLVSIKKKMARYDPRGVQGSVLSSSDVDHLYQRLQRMDLEQRKQIPGLQPERADIILAGTEILGVVMRQTGRGEITASEADLLTGLILDWSC